MGPKRWGPKGGAPKGGAPKGGPRRVGADPEGWGPQGGGAQNFALCFPSPAIVFILFSLSSGSFCGILVVLKRPEMCTFGVLGLSCEAPAAPKPPGVSHDSPRAQTSTFEGPGFQKHHQNSTQGPPREMEKE